MSYQDHKLIEMITDTAPGTPHEAELATDIGHKALYALVTGIAYDTFAGRSRARL